MSGPLAKGQPHVIESWAAHCRVIWLNDLESVCGFADGRRLKERRESERETKRYINIFFTD